MMYSWVIPVQDEAQSLEILLSEIKRASSGKRAEIIAVNDGSTDGSAQILGSYSNHHPPIRLIHHRFPHGKWAALSTGIKNASGDVIITIDADLQDNPLEVSKLIEPLCRGYDIVSGWRTNRQDVWYKKWVSHLGNWYLSQLSGIRFHDLNSPFKVYRARVLPAIISSDSLFRFSLLRAYQLGYRITETPIAHRPRLFGTSKFGIAKYAQILLDLILFQRSPVQKQLSHRRFRKPWKY